MRNPRERRVKQGISNFPFLLLTFLKGRKCEFSPYILHPYTKASPKHSFNSIWFQFQKLKELNFFEGERTLNIHEQKKLKVEKNRINGALNRLFEQEIEG